MLTSISPRQLLSQNQNQGTGLNCGFPSSQTLPPESGLMAALASDPRRARFQLDWAPGPDTSPPPLPQVTAHSLRLPPTSLRLVPSIMVMSAASGSLPAAHAFLHNKNASILLPPMPFKLSVLSLPQRALFSFWCLRTQTQDRPRARGGVSGSRGRSAGLSCTLRKPRFREKETPGIAVEVRLEPMLPYSTSSLPAPCVAVSSSGCMIWLLLYSL